MLPTFGLVVVTDSLHKKALMNALILVAATPTAEAAAAEVAAAAAEGVAKIVSLCLRLMVNELL